jgi:hypothetical protein
LSGTQVIAVRILRQTLRADRSGVIFFHESRRNREGC